MRIQCSRPRSPPRKPRNYSGVPQTPTSSLSGRSRPVVGHTLLTFRTTHTRPTRAPTQGCHCTATASTNKPYIAEASQKTQIVFFFQYNATSVRWGGKSTRRSMRYTCTVRAITWRICSAMHKDITSAQSRRTGCWWARRRGPLRMHSQLAASRCIQMWAASWSRQSARMWCHRSSYYCQNTRWKSKLACAPGATSSSASTARTQHRYRQDKVLLYTRPLMIFSRLL